MHRGNVLKIAAAATVALMGVALMLTQAAAQSPTVKVTSGTISPGSVGDVRLEARSVGPPGLGAWEVGITYDADAVTPVDCDPGFGGVCNINFGPARIQVVGASAGGLDGTNVLAGITFRCNVEGASDLNIILDEFADATEGGPRPIGPAVNAGRITCAEPAGLPEVPTSEPGTVATPAAGDSEVLGTSEPTGLPAAGSGGTSSASSTARWLIAALATAGLVTVTAFGASQLIAHRARRD